MTFDAIVIGAGINGMTLSAYLQRAGLETLVVEAEHRVGGMARSTRPLLPGFVHNPHANYLMQMDVSPVVRDLELADFGLHTLAPVAQHGIAFADGRPPIVLHRWDRTEQTIMSVQRYSSADARLLAQLLEAARLIRPLIGEGMYAPPSYEWFRTVLDAVASRFPLADFVDVGRGTCAAHICGLFQTPELQTLLLRVATELGVDVDERGSDLAFLTTVLPAVGRFRLPKGGMGSFANSLRRACDALGVRFVMGARVDRIKIGEGAVQGVVLAGGESVSARRLVASSLELTQTLRVLVGVDVLSDSERTSLGAYEARQSSILASSMFCLSEPPKYRSARWDPDIDRCYQTMIGLDEPEDALAHARQVRRGLLPAPAAAVRVNSLWDRSQAPFPMHTAGADSMFPSYLHHRKNQWQEVSEGYNTAFLRRWSEYAPNMSEHNILAHTFVVPDPGERKVMLRMGSSQYRTSIDGLYVCGVSTHPGGGAHGASGYNAYTAIAQDLGLSRHRPPEHEQTRE
ncbi:phytoene desaturase family protein [Rhodococcus rhodochrous]|uniref:Amine oxidase domain-containing protein n=1 Tax=Rhodococcus rhodochrous KG-21 TaxID=1441923 RepID=A0A0M9WLE5_RHORH|nr:NAD(P)/FAD-dependent oxidoreductase [Rhodococcus rhodochrous]KOS53300.1 hypothetical protein Z051_26330 [Rhodococcus rhodochrous KG-21]